MLWGGGRGCRLVAERLKTWTLDLESYMQVRVPLVAGYFSFPSLESTTQFYPNNEEVISHPLEGI